MRALALIAVAGCSGAARRPAPASPSAPPRSIEACVKDFVAAAPFPHKYGAPTIWTDPGFTTFMIEYGEPQDCWSGCFNSSAYGIATRCDRIGWIVVHDYDHTDKTRLPVFVARADDAALFDEARWPKSINRRPFLEWLVRAPGVPDATRAKAKQALAELH